MIQEKILFSAAPPAVATAVVFGIGALVVWLVSGVWRRKDWRKLMPVVATLALGAGLVVVPVINRWLQAERKQTREAIRALSEYIEEKESVMREQTFAGGGRVLNDAAMEEMKSEVNSLKSQKEHLDAEYRRSVELAFEETFPVVPDPLKWWHRGLFAILVTVVLELVARSLKGPTYLGHIVRCVGSVAVAVAMTPENWWSLRFPDGGIPWVPVLFAGTVMLEWVLLAEYSRRQPGGTLSACLTVVAGGTACVVLHDGSARFTDFTTFVVSVMTVLAVGGWLLRADVGGSVAVVPLLTVLMIVREEAIPSNADDLTKHVPVIAYWLVALAPLLLAVFLIPPVTRLGLKWYATPVKLLLVVIPVAIAIYLCLSEAPLQLETESWE
jgi:hypothetical protein